MNHQYKFPEFRLLSEFLSKEDLPDYYPLRFLEDHEADNRFALSVHVRTINGQQPDLLRKLATFFGCPEPKLPEEGDDYFEASDSWHGRGIGNLRDLADEISANDGQFFDIEYTVLEIRSVGSQARSAEPVDYTNYTVDESLDPQLCEAMVTGLEQTRRFLTDQHGCAHWKLAMVVFNPENPSGEYLVVGSAGEEALEGEIEQLMQRRVAPAPKMCG